eukprot:TRINITY_DN4679_c0_g1_i1.p1 TRINITY_DN4679_c0_g1~~TRINITY_DN4679_c0_g1_i1.p1  ORF type:complete len:191 (-),score=60.77 TRINITY_DN4679_c0_g1_i1:56-628(-)
MGSIRRPKRNKNRPKVVQKPKRTHHKVNAQTMHPKIREIWDFKKTPDENYRNMGLLVSFEVPKQNPKEEEIVDLEEMENIPGLKPGKETIFEELFPEPAPKPKKEEKLSEEEQRYYKKLIDKYGDNYKAMSRDIKLNNYQHVESKLKKKCELYNSKYLHGKPKGNAWKNHPLPRPAPKPRPQANLDWINV